jgi:hypothetical protein
MVRKVSKPNHSFSHVYNTCMDSVSDSELRSRLISITNDIDEAAVNYNLQAKNGSLYKIPSSNWEDQDIILGKVSKIELTNLYTNHMVPRNKKARFIYDELLNSAPYGKCPFCGIGQVSTLDHYLPKSKFPQYSVLPVNLVPSCKDCNTGKSSSIYTNAEDQTIHPYYDHENLLSDQWLFAEIERNSPISIKFYVKVPINFSEVSKERLNSHFIVFNLSKRFSVEAASELVSLNCQLSNYFGEYELNDMRKYLTDIYKTEYSLYKNSWKTAMYQSIANDDWYCGGGFKDR